MGCAKIETLFGKVRKSREKIDQVLTDLFQYQKEFETIVINKKCRPAKLKISRKIMETRLDCYKNYLLHLQAIIDDLEREIRQYKMREKELDKQAKIAGVGVTQKHNTYADQLQKKIKMLEDLIEKKKKMGSSPKRGVKLK
jgi:flagellar biosynthesis chaperone FliJ